ncbi:prolyl-tRNA synthetase associated domain-containing protein [Candidatus Pacearchaeota archaeon]|nr:prolyl-tRNA synthetase associated domain-containing protein [Candidatus Pacearchaeota archaeon]
MEEVLKRYLQKHGISYKEYQHPAVFTVKESAKLKINIPGFHTKNLFLKDEYNTFYLVCMDAHKRLDTNRLKEQLNVKSLAFASPEELNDELRVKPGSVSFLALIHAKKTTLVLDKAIWNADEVGFHPNVNTETLVLSHAELEKIYDSFPIKKMIIPLHE